MFTEIYGKWAGDWAKNKKKEKTEGATGLGLGRIRRFQTGGRHQKRPASLRALQEVFKASVSQRVRNLSTQSPVHKRCSKREWSEFEPVDTKYRLQELLKLKRQWDTELEPVHTSTIQSTVYKSCSKRQWDTELEPVHTSTIQSTVYKKCSKRE